jgi:hypothetical protein
MNYENKMKKVFAVETQSHYHLHVGGLDSSPGNDRTMGKDKSLHKRREAADRTLVEAVAQSNKLISQLLDKLELRPEERMSADIIGMETLRYVMAEFVAARSEAKKRRVYLRIRVAQAALAAALQGIMVYPVEEDA